MKLNFKNLTITLACLISTSIIFSQNYFGPQVACSHESCGLEPIYEDKFTYIGPPHGFEYGGARDVVISVNYNGFSTSAQNAFQYAVDIWASILTSNVPITINATYTKLGGGVLGAAGANDFEQNFTGAPVPNTFYPAALANKLAGVDLNPGTSDISCTFNSSTNWYFGVDGNTPSGQFDFVSVVLHELGHGLGCLGGSSYNGGNGTFGFGGTPVTWDTFTELGSGTNLSALSGSALGNALTSNDVYWFGSNGIDGLNGIRPRLYAPSNWSSGSSYSHLNEGTYPSGNGNSLMTPFIGSAEAIHDPGPAMLGMFQDMGWEIFPECDIIGFQTVSTTPCDPVTNTFDLTVDLLYSNPPDVGFLNVNGTFYPITGSPQEFTFTFPANSAIIPMSAFFTAENTCSFEDLAYITAPSSCCSNVRITSVNPDLEQFSIENFGSCSQDFSAYRICADASSYQFLSNLTLVSGDITLSPGESATFQWNTWNPSMGQGDLGLFVPLGSFSTPEDMIDYVQWGSPGNGGESVAVAAGYWTAGDYINAQPPYTFSGTGLDYGLSFWSGIPFVCQMNSITAGSGTECVFSTGAYTQEVIVEFDNPPGSGSLDLNGQTFSITSSPMTVVLTGLIADGQPVDVTASFTDDLACTISQASLFTAPEACPCIVDIDSDGFIAINDLTLLLAEYGCSSNCNGDLTGDDAVTSADITVFLGFFGTTCP